MIPRIDRLLSVRPTFINDHLSGCDKLSFCRTCGKALTEENWYPSSKRVNTKWCNDCQRAYHRKMYQKHKPKRLLKQKLWQQSHPKEFSRYNAKARRKLHLGILAHYSGTNPPRCANIYGIHDAPFTIYECLSIDHIGGGGAAERRRVGYGGGFYLYLKRANFPSGYQVLCRNCQALKFIKNKEYRNGWTGKVGVA